MMEYETKIVIVGRDALQTDCPCEMVHKDTREQDTREQDTREQDTRELSPVPTEDTVHDETPQEEEETELSAQTLIRVLERDLKEQQEILRAYTQQTNAIRQRLMDHLYGEPMRELALLSRNMCFSSAPDSRNFRFQVDRILQMFGAEAFAAGPDEPFDPKRFERNVPNGGSVVAECLAPGWICGETVLLRAVVITQ